MSQKVQAKGVVIDLVERSDSEGSALYYPVVDFPLSDGSRRRVESTIGSWPPAYKVDDTVTVTYNPADPGRAQVDSLAATVRRLALAVGYRHLVRGLSAGGMAGALADRCDGQSAATGAAEVTVPAPAIAHNLSPAGQAIASHKSALASAFTRRAGFTHAAGHLQLIPDPPISVWHHPAIYGILLFLSAQSTHNHKGVHQ